MEKLMKWFESISIHALRGEGDHNGNYGAPRRSLFQSTPSVGRATRAEHQTTPTTEYFNPRPPWGGRQCAKLWNVLLLWLFQSTPSVGRATFKPDKVYDFIYISIHALRGEGDDFKPDKVYDFIYISIHALRGEGDVNSQIQTMINFNFNPRPPWGGRLCSFISKHLYIYFNPRPPWGGRRFFNWFGA